ncbi:MAG: VanZ family protein [Nitrosomonadales bacterium]|nr:VanZ family protein [Nitrosomonadales bacterium]
MEHFSISESRARLRTWMASGYALFIAYASLSPFTGWREQGIDFLDVLSTPLLLTYTAFDAALNVLSYLPFGLLLVLALRAHLGAALSTLLGVCIALLLSAGMEYAQMYLPARTSSNMDMLSNGLGALIGALLAERITAFPRLFTGLLRWRASLFHHGKEMDFGLALLMLWIFGQMNPSLPMLGNVFISEVARQPFAALPPSPFDAWESLAVSLNLLMLGTLMLTLLRAPRHVVTALLVVLSVVALAKFVTAAVLLKSWALLLWINSEAILGIMLGMLLLLALLWLSRAAAIVCGIGLALSYFVIANFVFDSNDPAAAMSIYHWHYRHLLNYNGLAQTIMLVFPALLMFHLWRIRKV